VKFSRLLVIFADSLMQLSFIACVLILELSDEEVANFYTFIASFGLIHLITDSGFLTRSMKLYSLNGNWEFHILFHLAIGLILLLIGNIIDIDDIEFLVYVGLIITFNTHLFNALRFSDRNIEYLSYKCLSTGIFMLAALMRVEYDISLKISFAVSQSLVLIPLILGSSAIFITYTSRSEISESLVISSNSYSGWVRNGLDKFILAETVAVSTLATYSIVQQYLVIYQFVGAAISKIKVVDYFNSEVGLRYYRDIWKYHGIHFFIFLIICFSSMMTSSITDNITMLLASSVLIGNLNSYETPLLYRSAQKGYMFYIFSLSTFSYLLIVYFFPNINGVLYASVASALSVYTFNLNQWRKRKFRY
jgi:hypothetical protein